jgi:ubiquinone/menaquinone biosynthesis C-methylase UbiE
MTSEISSTAHFTPAAGLRWLTPYYDGIIALLTREERWRSAFVSQIAPDPEDVIVDLGCGTGTMLTRLARAAPSAWLMGVDPDPAVLRIASRKSAEAGATVQLFEGFGDDAGLFGQWGVTKIISSLVLHQVPLATKRSMLAAAHRMLLPGGEIHIADYGRQDGVAMRLVFRLTVQIADGVRDTMPQARGMLPLLIEEAGFADVVETAAFDTLTGTIRLYRARRD